MDKDYLNSIVDSQLIESNSLEFKGAASLVTSLEKPCSKHDDLSKDISAMANSNGGRIIYGLKESKDKLGRGTAESLDPINNSKISPDWLDQVINSRISPRIPNVKITPIRFDDASYIYIVDIPQSDTAHQAHDNKYYKRYNFQAVPMDDWEVKDVIGRGNKPKIEASFNIVHNLSLLKKLFGSTYELELMVHNKGTIAAQYINCFVEIEINAIKHILQSDYHRYDKHLQYLFTNRREEFIELTPNQPKKKVYSDFDPLLPLVYRKIGTIKVSEDFFKHDFNITCKISTEKTSKTFNFISSELYQIEEK